MNSSLTDDHKLHTMGCLRALNLVENNLKCIIREIIKICSSRSLYQYNTHKAKNEFSIIYYTSIAIEEY